jgi:hypothetical protein
MNSGIHAKKQIEFTWPDVIPLFFSMPDMEDMDNNDWDEGNDNGKEKKIRWGFIHEYGIQDREIEGMREKSGNPPSSRWMRHER